RARSPQEFSFRHDLCTAGRLSAGLPSGAGHPAPSQWPRPDSPPPCGEKLGVGGTLTFEVWGSPPPCPSPTRGEGTLWPAPRPFSAVPFFLEGTSSTFNATACPTAGMPASAGDFDAALRRRKNAARTSIGSRASHGLPASVARAACCRRRR